MVVRRNRLRVRLRVRLRLRLRLRLRVRLRLRLCLRLRVDHHRHHERHRLRELGAILRFGGELALAQDLALGRGHREGRHVAAFVADSDAPLDAEVGVARGDEDRSVEAGLDGAGEDLGRGAALRPRQAHPAQGRGAARRVVLRRDRAREEPRRRKRESREEPPHRGPV